MSDQVIDPVCGMHLDPVLAPFEVVYEDTMYYFCSDRCYDMFQANPEQYANPEFGGKFEAVAEGEELESPPSDRWIKAG